MKKPNAPQAKAAAKAKAKAPEPAPGMDADEEVEDWEQEGSMEIGDDDEDEDEDEDEEDEDFEDFEDDENDQGFDEEEEDHEEEEQEEVAMEGEDQVNEEEEEEGEDHEEEEEEEGETRKRRKLEGDSSWQSSSELEGKLSHIENQLTAILGFKGLSGNDLEGLADLVNLVNNFPDKGAVAALGSKEKDEFLSQTTLMNMRLLRLTKKLLSFSNQVSISMAPQQKKRKESSKAVGLQPDMLFDVVLKDVELNLKLPMNKQYTEIGLWKTVMKLNLQLHKEMAHLERRHGGKEKEKPKASQKSTKDSAAGTEGKGQEKTFRDYYMEEMTSAFGDDLNALREEDGFDGSKISLLVDCLETGIGIFGDLEKELALASFKKRDVSGQAGNKKD